ncbi:MAG: sterol desaturase family protein, partial [Gammaproteobacteria bacterium]|nr:sterol desaturase family protein [Gammaproteobacteria bacterium]
MNPIVYAIPVFMLTILAEAWIAQRRDIRAYDIADAITSLHFGVLSQVSSAFTKVFAFGIYVWVFESARLFTLPSDEVWVWVAALVAYDFLYYWVHRAGHEVNLVWASHQVHHSSEWYNLSTALRQTSTGALFVWPLYLPMAVLGVPPLVFGAVALIDLLYQYWVHTELVGKLGWLDRVFVTPSNHRVHHGQNDWCIDRNYGGILILWDRLFGTFAEERDDERVVYGIRK